MGNTAYGLVLEKLKASLIIAVFIGLSLLAVLGKRFFGSYMIGFLLGSLNLLLLSIELNLVISKTPQKIGLIHFTFFVLRYILIFYVIYRAVLNRDSEVFSLFGGLVTVNLSIIVNAFIKNLYHRREG